MTIETANRTLISSLSGLYDEREASAISFLVMERLTGMSKSLQVQNKTNEFTIKQRNLFEHYLSDLVNQRPVQYVLEEAWFGSYPFYVNEHVLIPRPETEELVDWLLKESSHRMPGTAVLDIGTGSGCIAICIKKKRKDLQVSALDIEDSALQIAIKNSKALNAQVEFFLSDIRDPVQNKNMVPVDLIISNPPYIPQSQKHSLDRHVRDYEPEVALFVPDDDPILFYKLIGKIALLKLKPEGALFLEIHHDYAKNILEWYNAIGFSIEMRKDFAGNNRMIKVYKN
ncbi:MAG TPA: peptide chain release factor N(5)-glutamine methyltransferase [Puia sp.]|nr:peptide chain release factor N(5)-glutamine methyltransferase [Puia sp.]